MEYFGMAKWIGSGHRVVTRTTGELSPALQLRKEFELEDIKNARCRICGLGLFVLYINGKRVGEEVLSPSFTNYDKRVLFNTYDLSEFLVTGTNVVAVKLGNGFFNQPTHDTWGFYQASWRETVKLLFQLTVNGKEVLVSDKTWKQTLCGATVHNAIRTGEHYDARKEDGWRSVGYDDSSWKDACVTAPPGGRLVPQELPPIRECEEYEAIDIWKTKNGWLFDFGKNISGYVSIKMQGKRGKTVWIRYSEMLNGKELDQSNISCYVLDTDEFSVDKYTFSGEGIEVWKPEFVYHGFRYVELSGLETEPQKDALKAYFVHTDLRKKGDMHTSNDLLNWIYDAGIRSFLSNFHGFSEDCPHREKNGWTGDAVISAGYAVCQFDMLTAYCKWMSDIVDSQRDSGQLPGIVPTSGWGYNWGSGPAWDSALFFLPYELYLETGDTSCLDIVYDAADKYLNYAEYYREDGLVCFGLSDWCPPKLPDLKVMSNKLSDSCYYYAMQMIMYKMAYIKGDMEKADRYLKKALETKNAIKKHYINGTDVDNNSQGALAEVLYFSIVEDEEGKAIASKLVEILGEDSYQHKVGILGMKALLNALSRYNYTDVAYKVVNRYDYPSYGYWKNMGATTLWENWDGGGSQNHHMYADVLNWMFRNIVGIKNISIAYENCLLEPYFFEEDCSACGETETPSGKIFFSWKKEKEIFTAEIRLPEGVCAVLKLPQMEPLKVTSGMINLPLELR
ncbi:MAG: family 78 glycoside hydrolase catalytic domain [Tyzzerella sp.]|nr:family 78 glycoside hydrolase catalytic domain [Tyzzerella sp.]